MDTQELEADRQRRMRLFRAKASFARAPDVDGGWAVRVISDDRPEPMDVVTVGKRSGPDTCVMLEQMLEQQTVGQTKAWLCSFFTSRQARQKNLAEST